MLIIIDDYFNTEEDELPTFQATTVHSVNQVDVTSNHEAASDQVDTTPASPSISPVTPSDQQQTVNSGEVQVMDEPNDEDSSTRPREVCNSSTTENIVILFTTEEVQSDCEADSDWARNNCQADSVMISRECGNSEAPPDHANEELSTAGHVSESASQMPTYAQQQASVPTNNGQVDSSVNSNFEDLNESQAMDFSDDVATNQQSDSQALFADEPFPTFDLVSLPSTSSGRRSTRPKKIVNYANAEEDSADEYSTVNRNQKRTIPFAGKLSTHKRVAADAKEEEDEDDENEEQEVGVEAATPLTVIVHHLNCPQAGCTEEFPDSSQLNGHLLSKHQMLEFRCKVKDCGLSFATQSELTDHRKGAHRNLKDWPCAQCEVTRKSYSKLHNHFWDYHEEGEFQCSADKCDFTAKTRKRVRNHHWGRHSSVKYECAFAHCSMSFKWRNDLIRHLRVHNQEKPFTCEQCPKAFTRKDHLTLHQRTHSGLKPYHCKWPGGDFSAFDSSGVNRHVRTVHFGLPASKKEQAKRRIIDTREAREFVEKMPTN